MRLIVANKHLGARSTLRRNLEHPPATPNHCFFESLGDGGSRSNRAASAASRQRHASSISDTAIIAATSSMKIRLPDVPIRHIAHRNRSHRAALTTSHEIRYASLETAGADLLERCRLAVPPFFSCPKGPQPQTSLEMSLGRVWALRAPLIDPDRHPSTVPANRRASRHHRDTVRAINDGVSAFWGQSRHPAARPGLPFLTRS